MNENTDLAVIIGAYLILLERGEMGPYGRIRVVERNDAGEIVWEPQRDGGPE